MAILSNQRHELYAAHRARGFVPAKAAKAAGFASGSAIYTSLEQDDEIINRITELAIDIKNRREKLRQAALDAAKAVGTDTGLSKKWVLSELSEIAAMARHDGDYENALKAVKMIGDEFNMFKGQSGENNLDPLAPIPFDMDKTDEYLASAQPAQLPPPVPEGNTTEEAPVEEVLDDATIIESLIGGNKKKPRNMSTGSETDVAFEKE